MANVAKDFAQLISQSKSNKTGPYDTQATVKRVEGNTVWVSIPGGVDETPIDKTVNCTAGDKVQVRVSGGRAWITGNASAPPTDDTTAIKARTTANEAQVLAVDAKETADAVEGIATSASATAVTAKTIAEGVNEHFWHDNTGAHVTEVTQEEWNEPTDPNYHSGGNTLITTQGMAIRKGLVNLAEFGAAGATIGVSGSQIAHLGYGPGTDSGGGISDAPYYTLGVRTGTVGNYSVAEGNNAKASGPFSHAEGNQCEAIMTATHAEGNHTQAVDIASHAEGNFTIAQASYSHAEGRLTEARGGGAHAEGQYSVAEGAASHAQNFYTIAYSDYQTALGKYNIKDYADTYAVIIGNGTADNARSNALTVAWTGDVEAAGDIEDGSGNVLSDKADSAGFYQIVQLAVTTSSSISAHGSYANDTYTVPAGDRPAGMTLAGIVGWGASNYRLSPSTAFVNGTHSISVTLANTSASSVSSGATVNFRLLYIKATSA